MSSDSVVKGSSEGGGWLDEGERDAICSSEAAGAGGGAGGCGLLRIGCGIGGGFWSGMVLWDVVILISLDVFSRIWTFDERRYMKIVSGAIEPLAK